MAFELPLYFILLTEIKNVIIQLSYLKKNILSDKSKEYAFIYLVIFNI